jgi:predicted Zn-dependent peptidase
MRRVGILAELGALALGFAAAGQAQDLASFEKRVTAKTLANGLTVLICERAEAPVFSFFTRVDVGADREAPGTTGLAHMFEHMAFKGTETIGTTDYGREKAALRRVEEAYSAYDRARRQPVGTDAQRIAELEKAWKAAREEAGKYSVKNEFGEIVEREGGVGLNAFTSNDETGYFYSFPSNRLELWAYLESERFLHPVLREFYEERDVVYEERRMSVESRATGRLLEQFQAAAFAAHPYHSPVLGWPSDLKSFSATDAKRFFEEYYVPANMVVTVVGDVKAGEVLALAERYFGRLPAKPKPEPLRTEEPPQKAERRVVLRETAQPFYIEGYHKGSALDPDDAVFDILSDLMSSGRTSRLYRSLVRDRKIAVSASGFSGYPGSKYPNLFAFFAVPSRGHAPEEIGDAIHEEIEKLKSEDVTDDELRMLKTRAKADLLRSLADNSGLAFQLGTAQAIYGDWKELFRQVDRIAKVSKADIRRVANRTFLASNRTVAEIDSVTSAAGPERGGKR